MVFSGDVFLFIFLPVVLFIYYVPLRRTWQRNPFLLVASLFFYAWGEPHFVALMVLSIVANYFFALWVDRIRRRGRGWPRVALSCMAVFNIGLLGAFKYLGFLLENLNALFSWTIPVPALHLPVGISFFTFQAISYVVDVYRGHGECQRNPLNVGLYISFFPQLIAGPIIRYESISLQIRERRTTFSDFSEGVRRFTAGLAKKVILADTLAVVADAGFGVEGGATPSVAMAWLSVVAFTMQIYYDFSGYSDMAIGLGRMFGFKFDENFNYPYISRSVVEFWRRWHISLGTWFRDYVYFPLGGSRNLGRPRIALNLFVVWMLTAVWHGASWNFVVWGLINYLFLVAEKFVFPHVRLKPPNWARHGYVLLFVVIFFAFFRGVDLGHSFRHLAAMFGIGAPAWVDAPALFHFFDYWAYFLLGALFCAPVAPWVAGRLRAFSGGRVFLAVAGPAGYAALFLLCLAYVVKSTYNPFIYFNF